MERTSSTSKDVEIIKEVDVDRIRSEIESEGIIDRIKEVAKDEHVHKYNDHFSLQGYGFGEKPEYSGYSSQLLASIGLTDDKVINPVFPKCTYINDLMSSLNMFRTRVMVMRTQSCLPRHCDNHPRIHIPVWSYQGCFMVVKNKTHYLNPCQAYFVNTTNMHTAMNCNITQNRVHIIVSVHEILGL